MINNYFNILKAAGQVDDRYSPEKKFTIHDTGISSKVINYWQEKELLLNPNKLKKNRKFNFQELLWLRLVDTLRKFTIGFDTIVEIKNELTSSLKLNDFISHPDIEKYFKKSLDNSGLEEYEKLEIRTHRDSVLPQYDLSINALNIIIVELIENKHRLNLIIALNEGEKGELVRSESPVWIEFFIPEKIEELSKLKDYWEIYTKKCISIPMHDLLKDVIFNIQYEKLPAGIFELSSEEKQIINFIRTGEFSSINIRFNNKKPYLAELSEIKKLKMESRLYEVIYKGAYQDLEIKTQDGAIYSCKSTRKVKL